MRRPVAALAAVFFLLGFIGGSWLSRVPAVSGSLHLSNGVLGLALLGLPVGSVTMSLALPSLLRRYGSPHVLAVGLVAACLTLLVPPAANGPVALALGLVLLGAATGAVDVAMNDYGVAVQARVGRSVFARLHALWSLGSFGAAGLGALAAAASVGPLPHLGAAAGLALIAAIWPLRVILGSHADVWPDDAALAPRGGHGAGGDAGGAPGSGDAAGGRGWSADRRVLALSAAALAAFVVEVVAGDWGGVYLRRQLSAGPVIAAGAFAAFALPHFLVRIFGDRAVDRVDRRKLLPAGLLTAAAGYGLLVAGGSPTTALVGLAVAGVGVALVVPVAFAGAGALPGVRGGAAVATAAGLGYVGWTASPPAVGGLAAAVGLRWALLLPVGVALVGAVAVRVGLRARAGG